MTIPVPSAIANPLGNVQTLGTGDIIAALRANFARIVILAVAALSFLVMTAVLVAVGSMAAPHSSGCLTSAVAFHPGTSIAAIMSVSGKRSCTLAIRPGGATIDDLSIETQPSQGRVITQGRRRVVYEPPRDFTGRDSFTLAVGGKNRTEKGIMLVRVAVVR